MNKPLTSKERESNKKAEVRMIQDNIQRHEKAASQETRRKDEAKEELLGQMDHLIPRSERSELTGQSRMFSFPKLYK